MSKQGYSIKEAAELLGKSDKTIRRYLKDGKLMAERVPRPGGFSWRVLEIPDEMLPSPPHEEVGHLPGQVTMESAQAILNQLRVKDDQIAALQIQLNQVTSLLTDVMQRQKLLEAPKVPWWRPLVAESIQKIVKKGG